MFKEILARAAKDYGTPLSDEQLAQFTRYYELLVEWNEHVNLTAITDPEGVAVKHVIDSISACAAAPFSDGTTVLDIGTGAGFPGLPLKLFVPAIRLTLMDSLNKRIRFLQAVTDALHLDGVTCVHARAEEAARDQAYREQFDIVCARAVARLPVLAEYAMPFVRLGGHFLALKGKAFAEEAAEAKHAVKVLGGRGIDIREVHLPGLSDKRAVLCIEKAMPTPKPYPRKAGTPAKSPIL